MFSKKQRLLFGGLLASVALAATAQTAPAPAVADKPANAAQAAPASPRMERGDPAKRHEQMQQRRAQRLAALKEKLKLDAAQEPAWNSFTAAQQPPQRAAHQPQPGAPAADRRQAAARADRAVRPLRHEHARAGGAGGARLPERQAGLSFPAAPAGRCTNRSRSTARS